jgi:hypothetical protein
LRTRNVFIALMMVGLVIAVTPAFAYDLSTMLGGNGKERDSFKLIRVADLAALIADKNEHLYIYDANPPDTRAEYGVIPKARMLPSADEYDVAAELPSNKSAALVFYCHNTY